MYFYSIGYTDWEDCPHITLTHTTLYTQEEFNQILLDAYVDVSKVSEKLHNNWYSTLNNEDKLYSNYKPRIDNLYSGVIELLRKDYGFKDIKINAYFMPSNTISIMDDEDEPELDIDGENKLLRDRFKRIEVRDSKINDLLSKDEN